MTAYRSREAQLEAELREARRLGAAMKKEVEALRLPSKELQLAELEIENLRRASGYNAVALATYTIVMSLLTGGMLWMAGHNPLLLLPTVVPSLILVLRFTGCR